jgi:hypothetical protein
LCHTIASTWAKREVTTVKQRWLPVGLLALAIFVVNGVARIVTDKGEFVEETEQLTIGFIAVSVVAVLLIGAAAWWAVRYPFLRLLGDIGAAVGAGALLSVLVGPFLVGSKPFAEGLGNFVGQLLLFLSVAAVGVFLGFAGVVAVGKDWKSRGLRRYEQRYRSRPHRPVRG